MKCQVYMAPNYHLWVDIDGNFKKLEDCLERPKYDLVYHEDIEAYVYERV